MKNKYPKFYKLLQVVSSLRYSQGFYSKLYNEIYNLDENEISEVENELPTFNKSLDVIMYLEQ